MPKCKVCGSRVQEGATKCPMCGVAIAGAQSQPTAPQKPAAQKPNPTPVQPQPQPTPSQPSHKPQRPSSSYTPPTQNNEGCFSKIIRIAITIIIIVVILLFIRNGCDARQTVYDIAESAGYVEEKPFDQYQVASYRDYELHPEKYAGKYIVFRGLCVTYLDRNAVSLYESSSKTTFAIQHNFTGKDLDYLAKKRDSFYRYNMYDTVNLYCYISKTGRMRPTKLE